MGRKAMAWGALAGTIPDLDVIAGRLMTAAEALRLHRGATRGLLFAFAAAPLLGLLVAWLYRKRDDATRTGKAGRGSSSWGSGRTR